MANSNETAFSRRNYLQAAAVSAASFMMAGCLGGDGGGDGALDFPSVTNRTGPGSENGIPIAEAEADLVQYINDEELLDVELSYHDRDAAYDPTQIVETFQTFLDEYDFGLFVGDGSPSGQTLANRISEEEILQVIPYGTLSPAVGVEDSYHVTMSTGYLTMNRCALELIAQEDPGAKVNFIIPPGNPAGPESAPALDYAEELDLERGEVLEHELESPSADGIMNRMAEDDVDWAVHTTGAPAHTVVLSSRAEIYPELNLVGVGPANTERRLAESPELYQGTWWLNSFKTFDEVAFGDGPGADVLETVFDRYRDESLDEASREIAVADYIRGMATMDLVRRIFEITAERDADLESGPELRESLWQIEDYEGWETMAPRTYSQADPRGTMTGRAYEASGDQWEFRDTIELERSDEWLPDEMLG